MSDRPFSTASMTLPVGRLKPCNCDPFTRAAGPGGPIVPVEFTDHPDLYDDRYWILDGGPQDSRGYPCRLINCPFCGAPAREVNR